MRVMLGWEPDKRGSLGSHHRELQPLCSAPAYETLFHSIELFHLQEFPTTPCSVPAHSPPAGIPHHSIPAHSPPAGIPHHSIPAHSPPAGIPHHSIPAHPSPAGISHWQHTGTPLTCRNFPLTASRHTPHLQEFPTDSIPAHPSPAGISHWQHTGTPLTCRNFPLTAYRHTAHLQDLLPVLEVGESPHHVLVDDLQRPLPVVVETSHNLLHSCCGHDTKVFRLWYFSTHALGISVHTLWTWHKLWYFHTHIVNMTQTLVFQYTHCERDTNWYFHTHTVNTTQTGISVHTLWNMTQTLVFQYIHVVDMTQINTNWYFHTHTVNMTQTGISVHTLWTWHKLWYSRTYTLWTWHKFWHLSAQVVDIMVLTQSSQFWANG